jgi:hypothetical protein
MIDQDQLVNAFRAWARDKDRPLAEHLAAHGVLDPDQRAGVTTPCGSSRVTRSKKPSIASMPT